MEYIHQDHDMLGHAKSWKLPTFVHIYWGKRREPPIKPQKKTFFLN